MLFDSGQIITPQIDGGRLQSCTPDAFSAYCVVVFVFAASARNDDKSSARGQKLCVNDVNSKKLCRVLR